MVGGHALEAVREGALDWGDWLRSSSNSTVSMGLKTYKEPCTRMRSLILLTEPLGVVSRARGLSGGG